MLGELRDAWREAVENFWRELRLEQSATTSPGRLTSMQRELASARSQLRKLDDDVARCRTMLAQERERERVSRRRENLARDVNDAKTAMLAASYASRHAEKASVLRDKLTALEAERKLLARDIGEMAEALQAVRSRAQPYGGTGGDSRNPGGPPFAAFERLERDVRERAAAQRLEEMKRRMGTE